MHPSLVSILDISFRVSASSSTTSTFGGSSLAAEAGATLELDVGGKGELSLAIEVVRDGGESVGGEELDKKDS